MLGKPWGLFKIRITIENGARSNSMYADTPF